MKVSSESGFSSTKLAWRQKVPWRTSKGSGSCHATLRPTSPPPTMASTDSASLGRGTEYWQRSGLLLDDRDAASLELQEIHVHDDGHLNLDPLAGRPLYPTAASSTSCCYRPLCNACCPCCRRLGVCPSPCSTIIGVTFALFTLIVLNAACWPSVRSPFFGRSFRSPPDPGGVLVLCVLLLLVALGCANRRKLRKLPPRAWPAAAAKRMCVPLLIYLAHIPLVNLVGRFATYPGEFIHLRDAGPSPSGVTFTFVSGAYDGAELQGYMELRGASNAATATGGAARAAREGGKGGDSNPTSNSGSNSSSDAKNMAASAVPVIFYTGNGQTMFTSPDHGYTFVRGGNHTTHRATVFAIYSFSWRGYYPNNQHVSSSEAANIADAIAFYAYVALLYPGQRPIVTSHSLGTGAAIAVAEHLTRQHARNDMEGRSVDTRAIGGIGGNTRGGTPLPLPACVGLGMPYASISQVGLELAAYTSLPWLYDVPAWNSIARIRNVAPAVPLLVLSAGRDRMIAPHHQREVMNASRAAHKYLLFAPDAGHNSLQSPIDAHPAAFHEWQGLCRNRSAAVSVVVVR